jgi:hypothetical protein
MSGLVTEQPKRAVVEIMDSRNPYFDSKELLSDYRVGGEVGCRCRHPSHQAHTRQPRKRIFIIFCILFLFGILLAGFCAYSHFSSSERGLAFWNTASEHLGGILKRATDGSQNGNGVFLDRKCT